MTLYLLALTVEPNVGATLTDYDAKIDSDLVSGLTPTGRLTEPAIFLGGPGLPFDFGTINGDGTIEFIVERSGNVRSGYLAVGSNTTSNLRLQQYESTNQLGMSQLGVADYLFSPGVTAPQKPVHIAYVWNGSGTMWLYLNGHLAGTRSGMVSSFGLPSGQGWLGASPSGTQGMSGTLYRVTCYDEMLEEAVLRRRAEAFFGINNLPQIIDFAANPTTISLDTPVTLSWSVTGEQALTLDDEDVTGQTQRTVTPLTTTTYTLSATNEHGSVQRTLMIPLIQPAKHVVINEFLASNTTGLTDEDSELSDWLELHNPTTSNLSLGGYFLTDKPSRTQQWALPAVELEAGGYRIIFLSGKDRALVDGELHANFRLGKEGEYLALSGPIGVVHEFFPAFPSQEDDLSYGLTGADPLLAGYLASPTPGMPNDLTPPRPARVLFSHPSGLLTTPFTLELTSAMREAEIWYELNGATPQRYTVPLNITTSVRIRAWTEINGENGSPSEAAWIKLAPDLTTYTSSLPVLVIDNFGAGQIPQKGRSANGAGVRQVSRQSGAWVGWERSGSMASTAQAPQFFSRIGVRGRGAFSSQWRQKPYNVEAWNEVDEERDVSVFGMPAHSDWILYFPDPDDNKDPTLLFNTFIYELSRRVGRYAPRFRWVELFVNEDGGEVSMQDRRGVYAVLEKVSRGVDRLDFQRLNPEGTQGGWLLSINRMDAIPEIGWPAPNGATRPQFFRTAGPNRIQETVSNQPTILGDDLPQKNNAFLNFDNPGGYVITSTQRVAIEAWFKDFEDVLYDNSRWRDPMTGYRQWLDDKDFAEYFIFNELSKNGDGMLISIFPWKGDDGRLRMGPTWDYNWSSYYIGGGPTGNLRWRSEQIWYRRLFTDPDFMQLYIDRWFAFRTGPMSNEGIADIIDSQAAEITEVKAVQQGVPNAITYRDRLNQMKNWLHRRANWVDAQYATAPTLGVAAGIVPTGQVVTLSAPSGTIYLTIDGQDPRASGGTITPDAAASRTVTLTADTRLTARVRVSNARWSAPITALYVTSAVPATSDNLVISEIHYHPADPTAQDIAAGFSDANSFEFVELTNIGSQKISLKGLRFVRTSGGEGVDFTFDEGARWSLEPGARVLVVQNATAFARRYGHDLPVAGEYTGRLGNGGDSLTLLDAAGSVVLTCTYDDSPPWPHAADGAGRSLTLFDGLMATVLNEPSSWRPSVALHGSPGLGDSLPLTPGEDLLAYAFGGIPSTWSWNDGRATVRQTRIPGTDAVTVAIEFSADLVTWTRLGPVETSGQLLDDGNLVLERNLPPETSGFIRWRVVSRGR